MLKEMTDLMKQVSAARDEMICDRGDFHAELEPQHVLIAMAGLIARVDAGDAWPHESVRDLCVSALAHVTQLVWDFVGDDLKPTMTREELEEIFRLDVTSASLVLQAMGVEPELREEADGKPELRVVH